MDPCMGLNVNLCQMLAAPSKLECPGCKTRVATNFDDYDIESPDPYKLNKKLGFVVWRLHWGCSECERDWIYRFMVHGAFGLIQRRRG